MSGPYRDIVFMQGEEAEEALRILRDDGEEEAIRYLSQWDNGDEGGGEIHPVPNWGGDDDTYANLENGYILAWNDRAGYIGLVFDLGQDEENKQVIEAISKVRKQGYDITDSDALGVAGDWLMEQGYGDDILDRMKEVVEAKTVKMSDFEMRTVEDPEPQLDFLEDEERYEGVDPEEVERYRQQDQDRLDSYGEGWEMYGVVAAVETPDGQRKTSPGLWGVESDAGRPYFQEIFEEEANQLADRLEEEGYYVIRDGVSPNAAAHAGIYP